jgi:hypothetical protein
MPARATAPARVASRSYAATTASSCGVRAAGSSRPAVALSSTAAAVPRTIGSASFVADVAVAA